jgi:2-polyprenyl-3-methyl-5-hydroxy-6-metoxy-1,4-benzoquinol methylase
MIDYTQWQPDPFLLAEAPIVADYAEFIGVDAFEVADKVSNCHTLATEDFTNLGSEFYNKSNTYIFDLLGGNPSAGVRANLVNKFIPNCVQTIKNHKGSTFADFGGGVGAMCEVVYTFCDKESYYIDIPSHSTDFAQWRFKKYGWDIKSLIISENDFDLPRMFDIIFTDAVWEHLSPVKQIAYVDKLVSRINPEGLFIMLVDLSGENSNMPMHFNVDIKSVHQRVQECGCVNITGQNTFASLWRKQ